MDCHIHVTAGTGGCKHIRLAVHRSSDDVLLGTINTTRAELEQELSEYDTARTRIEAQIIGIVMANKGKTASQLKTAVEAAVIRV
jgi:hypothetical protein